MGLEESLRHQAAALGVTRMTVSFDTVSRLMLEMGGRERYVNLGSEGEGVAIDGANGEELLLVPKAGV